MAIPAATRTRVRALVQDTSSSNPTLPTTDLDAAITNAISHYSADFPRERYARIAGDGSIYYPLLGGTPIVADWKRGLSAIISIEYPAPVSLAGTAWPNYLATEDWALVEDDDNLLLMFRGETPATGQYFRLGYRTLHSHDDGAPGDTIPSAHFDAFCCLSAYYGCQMLATKAAGNRNSTIRADAVNYGSNQDRYRDQAREWLRAYREGVQTGSAQPDVKRAPAFAFGDWDTRSPTNRPWLTHPERIR